LVIEIQSTCLKFKTLIINHIVFLNCTPMIHSCVRFWTALQPTSINKKREAKPKQACFPQPYIYFTQCFYIFSPSAYCFIILLFRFAYCYIVKWFRDASQNYGLSTVDCGLITASRPLFIFHF